MILKEVDSYSNLQRAFAFNISKEYFLRNPIIGIGTNNFILTLNNEHYYLPDFLMVGIHNEFFRIPVENGLVGLFLYLMRQTIIVASRNIEYDLKNEIYFHYQTLPMEFYKKNNTGDLINRISEDVSRVRMYLGPALMYGINVSILLLFIMFFSIIYFLRLYHTRLITSIT